MSHAAHQLETHEIPEVARFRLTLEDPIRIPDLKHYQYKGLVDIFKTIEDTPVKDLLAIRERTYEVLDRMDEILLGGGSIPPEQIDEIIRGIAVLEEVLIKKMGGKKPSQISALN